MSLKTRLSIQNTLAFRLTLWYALIFTLSSSIAFLLFYTFVTSIVRDRTDQELLGQSRRFAAILSTSGADEVTKAMAIEAQAAGVRKVFFRLLYPSGQAFSSSNMTYWKDITVNLSAIKLLTQGTNYVIETIVVPDRNQRVRILYAFLNPGIAIQVGESMEGYSRFLDAFKIILIFTMASLLIVAAGVGWFMAKRAVSGVEAVTRTARKISANVLEERVPVKDTGDEIDLLAITFNDMLDRIESLVREVKEMSDNIAHDLKSPITRIRGAAEVTLTTSHSIGEYEGMAASIIEECDRLLDMINTMLLISKTEAGVEKLSLEDINLSNLLRDTCEIFTPGAEDKGITLYCNAPGALHLSADIRMFQRMFSNLLDNAIKYTPSGGKVEVVLFENVSGEVSVSIRDTGIGISEGELPHIFERFYRGDRSRSTPGIGLGLSLSRAIARAHNGDITVSSVIGEGSTFIVTLSKTRIRDRFHSSHITDHG
jgi:heavy metal sensor kinase